MKEPKKEEKKGGKFLELGGVGEIFFFFLLSILIELENLGDNFFKMMKIVKAQSVLLTF